jgi:hypothetical protein
VSRSSGLLRVDVSRVRIFQSDIKTGGAVARMVYVTSSQRSCEDQVKDGLIDATGCVELCYPYFTVLDNILGAV